MPDFNPSPNDTVVIHGETYRVKSHPTVPSFAFGQEGRKAYVYQLAASNEYLYALKKFKPSFRVPELVEITQALAPLANWSGLEAAQRTTLQPGAHDSILGTYDDLTYAALMPWVFGSTWYDVVIGMRKLDRTQSITLAHSLADVLAALEEAGYAHCDIAAPNVIINLHSATAHLIDLEDMYIPTLSPPDALPAGTEGYNHKTAAAGLWEPTADRFAGAVLIAEIAAWHNPDIRKQADEEHYFEAGEMQQDSARYQLLMGVLNSLSPSLGDLFEQAWFSDDLADCPPLKAWHEVLSELHHDEQVAGVVSDWQPLAIPGIKPAEEGVQAKESTPPPAPITPPAAAEADTEDEPAAAEPAKETEPAEQPASPPTPAPAPRRRSQPAIQLPQFDSPLTNGKPLTPPPAASAPPANPAAGSRRPLTQPPQPTPSKTGRSPVKEWRALDVQPPRGPVVDDDHDGVQDMRPLGQPASPAPAPAPEPTPENDPIPLPVEADPPEMDLEAAAPPIEAEAADFAEEPEALPVEEEIAEPPVDWPEDPVDDQADWEAAEETYEETVHGVEYADETLDDEEEPVYDEDFVVEEEPVAEEEPYYPDYEEESPAANGLLKPILDLGYMDERNRPHLVWTESTAAAHYLLQEDIDPAFSDPKEYRVKGGDTRWSPGMFWRRSGRLYYRVRAEDDDELPGPWSEVIRVRIGR